MKQILVMRTDLRNTEGHKVRTGKLIAQGAHASLGAVVSLLLSPGSRLHHRKLVLEWLAGSFTKICVRVDSEEELLAIFKKAVDADLITCLINDSGRTEFNEPTITCCAIGPDTDEVLEPITGELKLL